VLKKTPDSVVVPNWLYKLSWILRRYNDFNLVYYVNQIFRFLPTQPWDLTKKQQWIATTIAIVLAGAPFTPYSHFLEHQLMELIPSHPYLATVVMIGQFLISIVMIKVVFTNILSQKRFIKNLKKNNDDKHKNH
jgi:hypothetical protein